MDRVDGAAVGVDGEGDGVDGEADGAGVTDDRHLPGSGVLVGTVPPWRVPVGPTVPLLAVSGSTGARKVGTDVGAADGLLAGGGAIGTVGAAGSPGPAGRSGSTTSVAIAQVTPAPIAVRSSRRRAAPRRTAS